MYIWIEKKLESICFFQQFYIAVEKSVVYAAEFECYSKAAGSAGSASVACHAFYHNLIPSDFFRYPVYIEPYCFRNADIEYYVGYVSCDINDKNAVGKRLCIKYNGAEKQDNDG